MATAIVKVFCTYRNAETRKNARYARANGYATSRQYNNMKQLLQAMAPYLEKHPWTEVRYQSTTVYVQQ
jgi:hypothetical protein